ncbi:MAG: hypothetical protein L0I76_03110 [Pseudonocardia sp.]|nr:hypothetical protein [Pseudonocardia sp.]
MTVIENFEQRHAQLWGSHTVRLKHSLHERPLFSDESLAEIIDHADRRTMTISTMEDEVRSSGDWHYCLPGDLSGCEILRAVKSGRIWINFTHIAQFDARFASVLDELYADLETLVPGFRPFKRNMGLLISSPGARVGYHTDIPGQTLLQLRGSKRLWIYPASEPFLKVPEFEDVVRRVTEEDITYESWFDDYAEVYDLVPGDLLHWRLNGPHKVANLDSVNVSITTQHWTGDIRREFALNYGNGLLRNMLHYTPRSRKTSGPAFWVKAGTALTWRKAGMQNRQSHRRTVRYHVDPDAPNGVRLMERQRFGISG